MLRQGMAMTAVYLVSACACAGPCQWRQQQDPLLPAEGRISLVDLAQVATYAPLCPCACVRACARACACACALRLLALPYCLLFSFRLLNLSSRATSSSLFQLMAGWNAVPLSPARAPACLPLLPSWGPLSQYRLRTCTVSS